MNDLLLNIINVVLENNVKPEINKLTSELKLRDDLGFDSLALAELTVRIESEIGIDVFEDGMVYTIGEIIKKIDIKNDK